MKKTLLTFGGLLIAMAICAQNFTGLETCWRQDWNSPSTDCAGSGAGAVGHMDNNGFTNTNFSTAPSFNATEHAVQITSNSSVTTGTMAGWNGFLYKDAGNVCNYIRNVGGVDMSATGRGKLAIVAKASNNGAKLRIYLGTTGTSGWTPVSSTYNTGSGSIIAEFTLTTSYTTYTFDYEAADPTVWAAWSGKTMVNQWGFDPQTASTDYFIRSVEIVCPSSAQDAVNNNAISVAPNPASDFVQVSFTDDMSKQNAVVKLISANGTVVYEGTLNADATLSLAGYQKGVYMLQVISNNKVATQRVVIQ